MLTIAAFALFAIGSAQAVHDTGAFELDGNAVSGNAPAPAGPANDWDRVCFQATANLGCGASVPTSNPTATAVAWTGDCSVGHEGFGCGSLNATTFTGGGSKDPQDIPNWAWNDGGGGLPAKDNLLHGFAARFSLPGTNSAGSCPNGTDSGGKTFDPTVNCSVIFFGSDRYDNSGDAQQGFWFFQNKIGLGTNSVGGGTGFTGVHKDGDLLVISDFSVGGTTSTITVYKWDSTCKKGANNPNPGDCGDSNLRLLATSTNAKCASSLTQNDAFCGIVNASDGTPSPWSTDYTDKSGNHSYLAGELYEGGINLSTLGLGNECFASVASETRSSTSTTATLKDFILSNFGACTSGLTTTADGSGGDGTIGSGSVSSGADEANLVVTGAQSWTGTLSFYLCGPLAASATTCDPTKGVLVSGPTTVDNTKAQPFTSGTATLTSAGHYCWAARFKSGTSGVPDASDNQQNECFDVAKVNAGLVTQASATNGGELPSTVSDTATLSGAATAPGTNGANANYPSINATPGAIGGSISWTAFGPNDCSTVALASTSRTVSGNGTYPTNSQTAVSFSPSAPGTYTFVASYTPDTATSANTNGVAASACPDTTGTEAVTITGNAHISTAQDWLPNDTATLTGDTNLNGSVTFKLFNDNNCGNGGADTAAYTQTVPVSNAASGSKFSTTNTNQKVTASGDWSWQVTYTDNVLTSPAPSCEKTTVTITN
jgi:hypothetical protein